MGTENRFKPGDTVQHFKRETLSDQDRAGRKYLYEIVGVALHTFHRFSIVVWGIWLIPFVIGMIMGMKV